MIARHIIIASSILLASSCSNKLKQGIYKYGNNAEFTIQANNEYQFRTLNSSRPIAFSRGTYKIERSKVHFYPDSNFIFQIKVIDAYFDSSLRDKKKVVIQTDSTYGYKFYFLNNSGMDTLFFDENLSRTFENNEFKRDQIAILAELNEQQKEIMPRPVNSLLASNVVSFFDLSKGFDKWNVLKLKLNIKPRMFSYLVLGSYFLYKGKLIEEGWPVYKFSKQQ